MSDLEYDKNSPVDVIARGDIQDMACMIGRLISERDALRTANDELVKALRDMTSAFRTDPYNIVGKTKEGHLMNAEGLARFNAAKLLAEHAEQKG